MYEQILSTRRPETIGMNFALTSSKDSSIDLNDFHMKNKQVRHIALINVHSNFKSMYINIGRHQTIIKGRGD